MKLMRQVEHQLNHRYGKGRIYAEPINSGGAKWRVYHLYCGNHCLLGTGTPRQLQRWAIRLCKESSSSIPEKT